MRVAQSPAGRRRAFTLVELLVVISILGVLIGLLLPAVQAVRGAARRTVCAARQRELGVALANYHCASQSYPIGCLEWRARKKDTQKRQLAWAVHLLPYLEAQNIYDLIDLSKAYDAPENAGAAAEVIPSFLCPSSRRSELLVEGRGACDYGGIYGERISGPNQPPKGTMLHDRPISERDIVDGLEHTLIVSEDAGFTDGQWINGRNVFDQAYAINAAPPIENDIRSDHGGWFGPLIRSP